MANIKIWKSHINIREGSDKHKPSKDKVVVYIHHVHRVAIKDTDMYPDSILNGPLSTPQRNHIRMAFGWWVNGGWQHVGSL